MRLITLFFILIFMQAGAQNRLEYAKIVSIQGSASRDELYNRARQWHSDNSMYQRDLKLLGFRNGELVWIVNLPYTSKVPNGAEMVNGVIEFSLTVQVYENAYSYNVSWFWHKSGMPKGGKFPPINFGYITTDSMPSLRVKTWGVTWEESVYNEMKGVINAYVEPMVQSLQTAMDKPAKTDKYNITPGPALSVAGRQAIEGTTKLHQPVKRALMWFNATYGESGQVRLVDDNRGILFATASFAYPGEGLSAGKIYFDFMVKVSADRYEYEYTNFYHRSNSISSLTGSSFMGITTDSICPSIPAFSTGRANDKQVWDDIKATISAHCSDASKNLKLYMLKTADADLWSFDHSIKISESIDLPNLTATELYKRATNWFTGPVRNKAVELEYTDSQAGSLTGLCKLPYSSKADPDNPELKGYLLFSLTVNVVNNKAVYTFSNIAHVSIATERVTLIVSSDCTVAGLYYASNGFTCTLWTDIENAATTGARVLAASLKEALLKPSGN